MVRVELTEEEAKSLQRGIERFPVEYDREVAATDSREFREDLKATERVLQQVEWMRTGRVSRGA